jgi:hypothetical protein
MRHIKSKGEIMDIEVRTKNSSRILRNVDRVEPIPMGCKRVFFRNGTSCKVKQYTQITRLERG